MSSQTRMTLTLSDIIATLQLDKVFFSIPSGSPYSQGNTYQKPSLPKSNTPSLKDQYIKK